MQVRDLFGGLLAGTQILHNRVRTGSDTPWLSEIRYPFDPYRLHLSFTTFESSPHQIGQRRQDISVSTLDVPRTTCHIRWALLCGVVSSLQRRGDHRRGSDSSPDEFPTHFKLSQLLWVVFSGRAQHHYFGQPHELR